MEFYPLGLRDYPQFIVYRLQPRPGHPEKTDKIPVDPLRLHPVNCLDPVAWMTCADANKHAGRLGDGYGIGFVFTEHDPFWFLDIDNCLQPDGTWSPLAINECNFFPGSLVEVSSSTRGLHIIGSVSTVPGPHTNRGVPGSGLEFYDRNRFVALTGHGARGDASVDSSSAVAALIERHFKPRQTRNTGTLTDRPCDGWRGHTDDDNLIQHALRMDHKDMASVLRGKALFKDLYENNTEVLARSYIKADGQIDESAVDMALAGFLAWMTGKNGERILRLMKRSKLVRIKWERESDYLIPTIIHACDSCTSPPFVLPEVRQPATDTLSVDPQPIGGHEFISLEDQKALFKNCTYIQDHNGILVPSGEILTQDQFRVMFGGFKFPLHFSDTHPTKNAWEAFTQNRAWRYPRAHQTCFRPGLPFNTRVDIDGRLAVNMFIPAGVRRLSGDPSLFLALMEKMFQVPEEREIVMAYAAALVQHQGKKFTWCLYIQGTQGNGKTVLTKCIEQAIGWKYCHTVPAAKLGGNFNDWFENKVLITVDDFHAVDSSIFEILKPYITSERLEIEGKNKKKYMADICANFIITSNHKGAIPITKESRRFAPIFTAQQSVEDKVRDGLTDDFFIPLHDWLENQGGYGIIAEYLHTYQIPDRLNPAVGCFTAPVTRSTGLACIESKDPLQVEVEEAIAEGRPGFRGGWISSVAFASLYAEKFNHKRMPNNALSDLMAVLGYEPHPGLNQGRCTAYITTAARDEMLRRPRLYILKDHKDRRLAGPAVATAYVESQR